MTNQTRLPAVAIGCSLRWPRILLSLAACLALTATLGCRQQPAADASQIPHTPLPRTEAQLTLANNNGQYRYEGVVADEATRTGLLRSLEAVYGGDATGDIALDPNTDPPPWAERLGELFLAFRVPGGVLRFQGKRIELSGAVPDEERAMLLRKARELYPDHQLTGLFEGVDMRQALPEAGDQVALLQFLNGIPIAFQADSGLISPASLDGLARAARAIKGAGKDTRLQVGVHPERTDMPEFDHNIAVQRANSIKVQLAIRGVNPGLLDATALEGGDPGQAGKAEFSIAPVPAPGLDTAKPPPPEDGSRAGEPAQPAAEADSGER